MFQRVGLTISATIFSLAAAATDANRCNAGGQPEVNGQLVSLVRTIGAAERLQTEPDPLNLSALDYLSSVYEEADYYSAGSCGKQRNKKIDARVYIHGLPEKMLGNFSIPVSGRITSAFGLREAGNRMHKGVDISLRRGDSVYAAFDGKVLRVGYEKTGYGYFIILEHADGIESRYAHLQRPLVKPGDEITAGQQIAVGGTSGNSTGPHLHFEIRCHQTPVDPTPLLSRR